MPTTAKGKRRREILTVEEAAVRLSISRNSAYAACARGEIPAHRIGRRIVIPRHAFEQKFGLAK